MRSAHARRPYSRRSLRWHFLGMGLAAGAGLALVVGAAFIKTDEPKNDWGQVTLISGYRGLDQVDVNVNVHNGCRIATFGRYPWLPPGSPRTDAWRRDTTRALVLMGMPEETAIRAVARLSTVKPDGYVGMGDTHGLTTVSGQLYHPVFTTTYRSNGQAVVCQGTVTNFQNNERQESALLYHIPDAKGRVWHVGEFLACGNVSLFTPAAPGWLPPGVPGIIPPGGGAPRNGAGPAAGAGGSNNVPEPPTWALVLLAAAAGYFAWRKPK